MFRYRRALRSAAVMSMAISTFILPGRASATPAAPVITAPTNGAIVGFSFVTVEGTADPGARVTVTVNTGGSLATTAGPSGAWSIGRLFSDASHTLVAVARDSAGVQSAPSASVTFTVDTVTPEAPRITSPRSGAETNLTTIQVSGSSEPNSNVEVYEGATLASVLAYGDGTFRANIDFGAGSHTITARAIDAVGHVSAESAAITFIVDTVPPPQPVITAPDEGAIVAPAAAVLAGKAERYATVDLMSGNKVVGITSAGFDGSWSIRLNLSYGNAHITARARDAAGNTGLSSAPRNFIVDGVAPDVDFTTADGAIFLYGAPAVLQGTASDDWGLGSVTVDFYDIAGRPALSLDAGCSCDHATQASWTVAPHLLPGRYIAKAYALDTVRNKSEIATISILLIGA